MRVFKRRMRLLEEVFIRSREGGFMLGLGVVSGEFGGEEVWSFVFNLLGRV